MEAGERVGEGTSAEERDRAGGRESGEAEPLVSSDSLRESEAKQPRAGPQRTNG